MVIYYFGKYIVDTGAIEMKRLIIGSADRIINTAVLDYYGIECSDQRDIGNLDRGIAYAIGQELKHTVKLKYPDAKEKDVSQFVSTIICYLMHMEPEIAVELTKGEPFINECGRVVDATRTKLTQKYAGSCLPNEELYRIIATEMLEDLERKFF